VETVFSGRFIGHTIRVAIAALAFVCGSNATTPAAATPVATATTSPAPKSVFACEHGATLATGRPDPDLFASEASKGVRAFWCEQYDENGIATRTGPYWEKYSNGGTRTRANYAESRLRGPVSIQNEDGSLFLRGFLTGGEWSGQLQIFHESGAVWFEAHFDSGRLDGALRTRFPDGALESETRYQAGREDGLARSFYPTAAGGRLKSEAHVEADRLVGRHRLLDRRGDLIRSIDWDIGPAAWRSVRPSPTQTPLPAAPRPSAPARARSDQKRDLRD
jgi:hypothetical protein